MQLQSSTLSLRFSIVQGTKDQCLSARSSRSLVAGCFCSSEWQPMATYGILWLSQGFPCLYNPNGSQWHLSAAASIAEKPPGDHLPTWQLFVLKIKLQKFGIAGSAALAATPSPARFQMVSACPGMARGNTRPLTEALVGTSSC